jgi:hypothetical protein
MIVVLDTCPMAYASAVSPVARIGVPSEAERVVKCVTAAVGCCLTGGRLHDRG